MGGVVDDAGPDDVARVALDPAHDDARADEQEREGRENVEQVEVAGLNHGVARAFGDEVQRVYDDHRPVPQRPDHSGYGRCEDRAVAEDDLESWSIVIQ